MSRRAAALALVVLATACSSGDGGAPDDVAAGDEVGTPTSAATVADEASTDGTADDEDVPEEPVAAESDPEPALDPDRPVEPLGSPPPVAAVLEYVDWDVQEQQELAGLPPFQPDGFDLTFDVPATFLPQGNVAAGEQYGESRFGAPPCAEGLTTDGPCLRVSVDRDAAPSVQELIAELENRDDCVIGELMAASDRLTVYDRCRSSDTGEDVWSARGYAQRGGGYVVAEIFDREPLTEMEYSIVANVALSSALTGG